MGASLILRLGLCVLKVVCKVTNDLMRIQDSLCSVGRHEGKGCHQVGYFGTSELLIEFCLLGWILDIGYMGVCSFFFFFFF